MPRVAPVASKADVAPEHQAVVDDVLLEVHEGCAVREDVHQCEEEVPERAG